MPIYIYKHDCGYCGEIFLNADFETTLVKCLSCGRKTIAKQKRDNSIKLAEHDGVTGVLERTTKDE